MSLLFELNNILNTLNIPVETGIFSGIPPDEYVVLTPMIEDFSFFADNLPQLEIQEIRLSLFSKNNYRQRARQITKTILKSDITVTQRRYIGFEKDTAYHNYALDCAKVYRWEED